MLLVKSYFFLLLIGFASSLWSQEFTVEVSSITNQPVSDVFLDSRGMVYALPLAEQEVLLRYDGNQVVRLGRKEYRAQGLELPHDYLHNKLYQPAPDVLISVSNSSAEVAIIDLKNLTFRLYDFAYFGIKGKLLSIGPSEVEDRWLSITEIEDGKLQFLEWSMNETYRTFEFLTIGKVRDAKQVAMGDTLLLDVYPTGSYYYTWEGELIDKIGDDDFRGWDMWDTPRAYKYFSELRRQPDGHLYTSLRWSFPSYFRFNERGKYFEPAKHPFTDREGLYVSVPICDSLGNCLYAGSEYYGQRDAILQLASGEQYELKASLQDAILGNRDHTNATTIATDNLLAGFWAASEERGLLRINFVDNRIDKSLRIFGVRGPLVFQDSILYVATFQNGIMERNIGPVLKAPFTEKHIFFEHRKKVIKGAKALAFDSEHWVWSNDYTALMGNDRVTNAYREIELGDTIGPTWGILTDDKALVGMEDGRLLLADLQTSSVKPFIAAQIPEDTKLISVYQDGTDGLSWIGTSNGFFRGYYHDPESWQEQNNEHGEKMRVHHVYAEQPTKWWLATDRGLVSFNPVNQEFGDRFSELDGLASNQVRSTIKAKGYYWIGTRNGMTRLDSASRTLRNFSHEEGFTSRRFTAGSVYLAAYNKLVFGTDNGLNVFTPEDLMDDPAPTLHISSLRYYDEEKGQLVQKIGALEAIGTLRFPAANRSLEVEYFLNKVSRSGQHQYAYRLGGATQPWMEIENRSRLSFSGLEPGNYLMEIKGKTRFSRWSEPVSIKLQVEDFFYNYWLFRAGLLLFIAAIIGAWIYRLRRESDLLKRKVEKRTAIIRRDKEIIEKQTEELKELDAAKTRFFSNISHEFRTPLTVIRGFAQEAMNPANDTGTAALQKSMGVIEANSNRLLVLVNQLLELGKLEAGKLEANYQRADLRPELDLILASFTAAISERQQRLMSSIAFEELTMDVDSDKLLKILYNLLSNAIKFTPEGGKIALSSGLAGPDTVTISVRDTGIGIPGDKLELIFQRFSQIDAEFTRSEEGSGIGLNYARELAELMGGSLAVISEEGKGSTFTLSLPRWQAQAGTEKGRPPTMLSYPPLHPAAAPETDEDVMDSGAHPLVLLVEDNADIIAYLKLCLGDQYRFLFARNGEEGLEIALEEIPDLIISDVMMPVMDGLEMCQNLKHEERTSHIPVIMLTALSSVKSRVKGLWKGADGYLSKPFAKEELEALMVNLLEGRKRLQAFFGDKTKKTPDLLTTKFPEEKEYTVKEEEFLTKIVDLIEARISDPRLRTDDLAQKLAMSKTQLWRKIKAVTGQSTGEFIESVKLGRAADMLVEGKKSVSEVAYEVGYTDPSYFTKRFSRRFGQVPSDYQNTEVSKNNLSV